MPRRLNQRNRVSAQISRTTTKSINKNNQRNQYKRDLDVDNPDLGMKDVWHFWATTVPCHLMTGGSAAARRI